MEYALDHVHIFTKDPDGTADWFAAHLGGKVLRYNQSDGRARIDVQFGDVYFYVSRPPKDESDAGKAARGVGINHLGFSVQDVDRAIDKMRAEGVEILQPPASARPGVRSAYVRGPEEIRIEIFRRDPVDRAHS